MFVNIMVLLEDKWSTDVDHFDTLFVKYFSLVVNGLVYFQFSIFVAGIVFSKVHPIHYPVTGVKKDRLTICLPCCYVSYG